MVGLVCSEVKQKGKITGGGWNSWCVCKAVVCMLIDLSNPLCFCVVGGLWSDWCAQRPNKG